MQSRGRGQSREGQGQNSSGIKKVNLPVRRLFIVLALNKNLKMIFLLWPLLQEETIVPQ